ncbi:MAG: SIR2 family protein [Candidatus Binatus sp.]|uniref:SIR2 family protein n=1 Tax=Candidatus Binatus sp. TaxID=2811406 RepID=UPI0027177131|nr:SIR2 family protein [Candidatus Binatus sp.]MDO8432069.1 SIR2 family protein [Candidatus Binatus sp.]
MASHDARKMIGDLRDHLARHDKPIAFLFGAGTSCAVKAVCAAGGGPEKPLIPAVAGLTEICASEARSLGKEYAEAWSKVAAQCDHDGKSANIEDILSRLRMMLAAIGEQDTLLGLNRTGILKLEETVRRTIAKIANPAIALIPEETPHRSMARWLAKTSRQQPVEIFTLNYDVLIEMAFEAERIPLFDGFVGSYRPFFLPDSLRRPEVAPGLNWVRLWKMHGSVTWRRENRGGRERIVRGEPDSSGEMILPSFHKYDESRQQPYAAFMDRLARFLDQDDALLVTSGFSFGDEHINNVIFSAIENRPRTHVYALQFSEVDDDHDLLKRAVRQRNLIVSGPKTGIIGGRRAEWRLDDPVPFVDVVFERDPKTEANPQPKTGQLKLGDFAKFCEFLRSMGER